MVTFNLARIARYPTQKKVYGGLNQYYEKAKNNKANYDFQNIYYCIKEMRIFIQHEINEKASYLVPVMLALYFGGYNARLIIQGIFKGIF